MTDPSIHQPSLWRCSVSESDTDPMSSATNPPIYLSRFILQVKTESQPNVSGAGLITESERRLQGRKIRAAEVLKRFEGMKQEFNEWKISAESQLLPMDVINDRLRSLTELSQVLAREAIMLGVELTLCGQISDYKNVIVEIKEKIKERIKIQSNLTSSPTYLSKTRELRVEYFLH